MVRSWMATACLVALAACADPNAAKPGLTDQEQGVMHIAQAAEQSGDYPGAVKLYQKIASQSKGQTDAHLALLNLYLQQDDTKSAADIVQKAEALKPNDAKLQGDLARVYIQNGKAADALTRYTKALTLDPQNPDWFAGKGVALDMLDRHEEAQGLYQEGLALAPDHEMLLSNLGLSLALTGKSKEAVALLSPKAAGPASTPALRQNLAFAYGMAGNTAKAKALMKQDLDDAQIDENLALYKRMRADLKNGKVKGAPPVGVAGKARKPTADDSDPFIAADSPSAEAPDETVQHAKPRAKVVEKEAVTTPAATPEPTSNLQQVPASDEPSAYPKPRRR